MNPEDASNEYRWTARKVRPIIALYVLGVFGGFMVMAQFVFQSPDAVKALFLAAIGGLVSLVPGLRAKYEYRLNESGVARRRVSEKEPGEFEDLFVWEDVSDFAPTSSGFKYMTKVEEAGPLLRFLKRHVLSGYSGEIQVEGGDKEWVRGLLNQRSLPLSDPSGPPDPEPLPTRRNEGVPPGP